MYDNFKEKEQYNILMDEFKIQNKEYIRIKNSQYIKTAILKEKIKYVIWHLDFKKIKTHLEVKKQERKIQHLKSKIKTDVLSDSFPTVSSNYFSKDRIAVYTVMFGNYDNLKEPVVTPDNVDFYLITDDCNICKESKWTYLNTSKWKRYTSKLDAHLKNRWFKTHPHMLFPDYKYSLYIDASIKIITDVTEHINKIGKLGIAMHKHHMLDCVYDELEVVRMYKRDSIQNFKKMEELYKSINFPKHYGLLEGCVIARRHNDENVICIMEDWWKYILLYCRRDQLSLPVVLYNNGVMVNEALGLGDNVEKNFAFRKERHLGDYGYVRNKKMEELY